MTLRSSSIDTRRWLAAGVCTVLLLSLQILYVAHLGDGASATSREQLPIHEMTPAVLVTVDATIVSVGDTFLGVRETPHGQPVSFTIGDGALMSRKGRTVHIADLRLYDRVQMTVDARTGHVLGLRADPAPRSWLLRLDTVGPLAAVALLVATVFLVVRSRRDPSIRTLTPATVPAMLSAIRGRVAPPRLIATGPRHNRPCGA